MLSHSRLYKKEKEEEIIKFTFHALHPKIIVCESEKEDNRREKIHEFTQCHGQKRAGEIKHAYMRLNG